MGQGREVRQGYAGLSALEKPSQTLDQPLSRVPFHVYTDTELYAQEQSQIFRGPAWNFLCLEVELPEVGSYRTTFIGETPVIVVRDTTEAITGFENRCAHRGALIAIDKCGKAAGFQCVYHAWSYNRQGDLVGVAFERGVRKKVDGAVKVMGGMPEGFCKQDHGPRKLKIAVYKGLVFGSFDAEAPCIKSFLGPSICARIDRVLCKPVKVIGRFTQALPNNWKLYFENVKDSYHASLLHLFFTTFGINRLSDQGGVIVSEDGAHHVSYSMGDMAAKAATQDASYKAQGLRSDIEQVYLRDPSVIAGFHEFDDGITLQILSVFPGFVLQQIQNCLAVRQILPKGSTRTELNWTYFAYEDDTPEQLEMRLKQANLVGAAGYVSMEDGAVGGFVQRGIAGASQHEAIVEMGGSGFESSEGRATETSVRGFWHAYRQYMKSPLPEKTRT